MEKVVIFGGSGFLGSHVCDNLSESGYRVLIYDRIESPWLRSDQEMVVGDFLYEKDLAKLISGCKTIFNFAAIADLDDALNKPVETVKVNILGNVLLLEACLKANVKRYVYASTIYVHSRDGGFYRCSKQSSEQYIEEYQRIYGIDYTILRYGSLYGPRSGENNGLRQVVKNALETGTVSYEGSPEAMREYIHVNDAALASITAMGTEFINQHVVLTGQEPMRVKDLLKMLAEILGIPVNETKFVDKENTGHYIRTPYSFQPRLGRKYIPPLHVDLGQGLLQLINEVSGKNNSKN